MAEHENGTWYQIAKTQQVSKRHGRVGRAGDLKVAVFQAEGHYYAMDDRCPHANASLGLGEVRGLVVSCRRHKWLFNLETGACVTNPDFEARTHPTRVRKGWIEVFIANKQ